MEENKENNQKEGKRKTREEIWRSNRKRKGRRKTKRQRKGGEQKERRETKKKRREGEKNEEKTKREEKEIQEKGKRRTGNEKWTKRNGKRTKKRLIREQNKPLFLSDKGDDDTINKIRIINIKRERNGTQ